MCLIVDANAAPNAFAQPCTPDYAPVIGWLTGPKGMLVYGGHLSVELNRISCAADFIAQLVRAGRARPLDDDTVKNETQALRDRRVCVSDDEHVVALARLSGARVLCTADQALMSDFKNVALVPTPKGRVYQNATHKKILGHSGLCGFKPRARG